MKYRPAGQINFGSHLGSISRKPANNQLLLPKPGRASLDGPGSSLFQVIKTII